MTEAQTRALDWIVDHWVRSEQMGRPTLIAVGNAGISRKTAHKLAEYSFVETFEDQYGLYVKPTLAGIAEVAL